MDRCEIVVSVGELVQMKSAELSRIKLREFSKVTCKAVSISRRTLSLV